MMPLEHHVTFQKCRSRHPGRSRAPTAGRRSSVSSPICGSARMGPVRRESRTASPYETRRADQLSGPRPLAVAAAPRRPRPGSPVRSDSGGVDGGGTAARPGLARRTATQDPPGTPPLPASPPPRAQRRGPQSAEQRPCKPRRDAARSTAYGRPASGARGLVGVGGRRGPGPRRRRPARSAGVGARGPPSSWAWCWRVRCRVCGGVWSWWAVWRAGSGAGERGGDRSGRPPGRAAPDAERTALI